MNLKFFASLNGVVLVAAGAVGIGLAELATSAPSPANASPMQQVAQASSLELEEGINQESVAQQQTVEFSRTIGSAVLQDVAQRSRLQVSDLEIVDVQQKTWSDGCLGLGGVCTQAEVPGWQVVVASAQQLWVYRTNQAGSVVKLDEAASQTLTSRATAEIRRRQEVTTRTTQRTQATTGTIGSQSRTTAGMTEQQSGMTSRETRVSQSVQTSFTDVAENHWARGFIAELATRQIIEGFPDGRFRPNEPVTRAQFAAMLRKAFKKSKVRNAISFRDISSNHWAYTAIREAYEMGFLGVSSGSTFNPSRSLSRLDVLVALTSGMNYSFSGSTDTVLSLYSDATTIPTNVRSLIAAATQRGIVVNYPNVKSLSLNTVATRADVAAFIYQTLVSTGEVTAISSPYVVGGELGTLELNQTQTEVNQTQTETEVNQTQTEVNQTQTETEVEGDRNKPRRNCNQGIGNGAEGCDPGNSRPHGGSNDEGGRTPGNRP